MRYGARSLRLIGAVIIGFVLLDSSILPRSVVEKGDVKEEVKAEDSGGFNCSTVADTLRRGESVYLSLGGNGVSGAQILELLNASKKVLNLRRSYPGDHYSLSYDSTGVIRRFEYRRVNAEEVLIVKRVGDTLTARKEKVTFEKVVCGITGRISGSLWESIVNHREKPELVLGFTDIFQWDIDFFVDPREGDEFTIVFEEYREDGRFVKYGRILAARYKDLVAIFHHDPDGHQDYYDLDGRSFRKAFLRSPLNYRRISSHFSCRRLHPIFKIYRPHLGVDYAAPVGTPVVASADGIVVYVGWNDGFGKFVKIKHGYNCYTTYGHLSRYGRGIRRGIKVKQRQVIGYVGQTGIATGPHLDYRFIKDGRLVNPLKVNVPAAAPVRKKYRGEFRKVRDRMVDAIGFFSSLSLQRDATSTLAAVEFAYVRDPAD